MYVRSTLNPVTRAERPFRPGSDEEKLFLAAVGMIPRHYRSFDMGAVMDEEDECGTVCCFAALVGLLMGHDFRSLTISRDWFAIAKAELGLGTATAINLFFPNGWPAMFHARLDLLTPRTPEYAAVAVERFMHFYETGE